MFLVFPFFAVFSSSQQSAVLIGWRLHLNTVWSFHSLIVQYFALISTNTVVWWIFLCTLIS